MGLFSFNSGRMGLIFANNSGRKCGCLQAVTSIALQFIINVLCIGKYERKNMKSIFMTIGAALFMIAVVSDANAVTCAKGVYRAGPNGVAVVRRPVGVSPRRVVVAPAPVNRGRCAWVNGRKVCR